jgi:hypothetical protein
MYGNFRGMRIRRRLVFLIIGFKDIEPEFVNLFRSPGINSQPAGPVRQPYLTYRPTRLHRLAESIPWNLFQDFLNLYKFGLRFSPMILGGKKRQQRRKVHIQR